MMRCDIGTAAEAMGARLSSPHTHAQLPITGVSTDSRTCAVGELFFALAGERHDGHAHVAAALERGAVAAVVQRPATPPLPAGAALLEVDNTRRALGRLAHWNRDRLTATVIAVTGSNGKTTTKTLIAHLLSGHLPGRAALRSFNNDIGVPLTLLSGVEEDAFLVVEVGTNAPGEIAALARIVRPDIAVVTGIGLAHLERLGDIDGVVAEKMSLLPYVRPGGSAVVNIDEPRAGAWLSAHAGPRTVTYGLAPAADVRVTDLCQADGRIRFAINGQWPVDLALLGAHNAVNAAGAIAVGCQMGLSGPAACERMHSCVGPDMRLEIQRIGSTMVINDSYNANPSSTRAAVEVLRDLPARGRRVAILGDMRELGDRAAELHDAIGQLCAASAIDVVVGVGDHAERLTAPARAAGVALHTARTAAELAPRLRHILQPDDTILLKGSRAVQLDTLLDHWPGRTAPQTGQVG